VSVLGELGVQVVKTSAVSMLSRIDFNHLLLHGLLAYLLFAGGLNLKVQQLSSEKIAITLLATLGVVISTAVIGAGMWLLLDLVGLKIPLIGALLFGALISPTDPVSVLAILRTLTVPPAIEAQIAGESLFNDGLSAVLFMVLLSVADSPTRVSALEVAKLLAIEAFGGIAFGLAAGFITYLLLARIDDYKVEILLTLALATGGYALADWLGVSAPLAIVVAGLLIGNEGRASAMSATTETHLDVFWELLDEILNAILFLLIGAQLLLIPLARAHLIAAVVAIPLTLVGRFISVGLPISMLRPFRKIDRGTIPILTWSGLRGGISVALALSIPPSDYRNPIIVMTYAVVIFSVIVQGLTIRTVILRTVTSMKRAQEPKATAEAKAPDDGSVETS
jgi:monovalent cation:H+ antiporter, CPA1 family